MKSYRTVRTSIVVVSVNGRKQVFSSIDEVPAELRGKLVESTSGAESGRILIADQKGRDLLLKSLRDRIAGARRAARPEVSGSRYPGWIRTWGALLIPGLAGLMLWLAFTYR